MRKSFSIVLMIGALIGCQSTGKNDATPEAEAAKTSLQTNAANVDSQSAAKQYRALCIEKEQHGGNEYVLSKWFDRRDKANELGQYHGDFKYKGHRWRIDERVKPEQVKR